MNRPWALILSLLSILHLHNAHAFSLRQHNNIQKKNLDEMTDCSRRSLLATTCFVPFTFFASRPANALALFEKKERRQLELCVVNLLRVQYWAIVVANNLETGESEEERKKAYLEARLGAKAIVSKLGGGGSMRAFKLKGLEIKDCLDDLKYYAKSRQMDNYRDDLIESLASIVEFDGLETTQDPSPRSSLTMGMYNDQKGVFVTRTLTERVLPLTEKIVGFFGPDIRVQCEAYVRQYYPNELPPNLTKNQQPEEAV